MIKIYGIKNCNSVKKTLVFFQDNNIKYKFFDLKKIELDINKISKWITILTSEVLVNKKSLTWKKLPAKFKENNSENSYVDIIKKNPTLIKRPLIEFQNKCFVGFDLDKLKTLK